MKTESLRGQFLIAAKKLDDRNFYRSVVLIVEHNNEGAMGLIVNRPSGVTVTRVLSEHFDFPQTDDRVYVGGPVEPSSLFIVHSAEGLHGGESAVAPGVFVGSSTQIFEKIVEAAAGENSDMRYRIYSGCSGWAPEQLEAEIARGDWYRATATDDLVFHSDPYQVYEEALKLVSYSRRIVPDGPENAEWN